MRAWSSTKDFVLSQAALRRYVLAFFLVLLGGCGGSGAEQVTGGSAPVATPVVWRAAENPDFPVSPAQAEGFNETLLEQGYAAAGSTNGLFAVLVLRNGRLVGEAYFQGRNANDLMHLRSVTKTVLSNLIALAISQGKIQSLQQPISELLPQKYRALLNGKAAITLADLLTMRSGFAWDESTVAGYNNWVTAADPTRYLLEQPQQHTPGTVFRYNSANFHLLSVILTEKTGMATRDFARQYLFGPLGIANFRWEKLSDGYDNGGAGLELRARDLAKLGLLWQQQGLWGSQQLISRAFLQDAATVQHASNQTFAGLSLKGYGYGWWLFQQAGKPAGQLGWGYGGQFVLTVPEQNLTVVLLANNQTTQASTQENGVMQLATQWLLPAAQ